MLTCETWASKPDFVASLDTRAQHVANYYRALDYIYKAFRAGKQKHDVLEAVNNLRRPASHWAKNATASR